MKAQTAVAKILKMEGVEFVTSFPNVAHHDQSMLYPYSKNQTL